MTIISVGDRNAVLSYDDYLQGYKTYLKEFTITPNCIIADRNAFSDLKTSGHYVREQDVISGGTLDVVLGYAIYKKLVGDADGLYDDMPVYVLGKLMNQTYPVIRLADQPQTPRKEIEVRG